VGGGGGEGRGKKNYSYIYITFGCLDWRQENKDSKHSSSN